MVNQQQPSTTADALSTLHTAEQKILSALTSASHAFRALSSPDSPPFREHSAAFLADLHAAKALVQRRIQHIGLDLPFENVTMRRLIEADLAVQRTAHVHRALVGALAALDEAPSAGAVAAAASPPYLPSPLAGTPLVTLGGVAPSPSPMGAPITIAVPSPDAAEMAVPLAAAVALNGGGVAGEEAEAGEEGMPADPDAAVRMDL